jgi:uncharacterized iron-regulated membrane protein
MNRWMSVVRQSPNGVDAWRAARLSRLKARRKLWLEVHGWLGLILGFCLAIFGITGSVLVFYEETDDWLNPGVIALANLVEGQEHFRPVDDIVEAARSVMPDRAQIGSIIYPRHDRRAYQFFYRVVTDNESTPELRHVFVNPYTAEVTGTRAVIERGRWLPDGFVPFMFQLHFALLAGNTGAVVVGIMGVISIISVLTGLIVWWPLTGKWRRALTIKRAASPERLNHDVHQTFGFYTALIMLAVLLSGVYMNLPDHFKVPVKLLSPNSRSFTDNPQSSPAAGRSPIGLDRALASVRRSYPEGRVNWLRLPEGETGVYTISIRDVPGLSRFWSERRVTVDQYSGEILTVHDPDTRTAAGDTFLDWMWPLHSGKVFGWPGRILIFVTGLACPVLYVTGVVRWLQKRRAKRSKKPPRPAGWGEARNRITGRSN